MTKNRKKAKSFDIQEFLSSAGKSRSILKFKKGQVIFSQDDPAMTFYISNQEMPS